MELNREQIIKALECCTYGGDKTKSQVEVCSLCPYFNEGNCTDVLKESALALIKELTKENEKIGIENFDLVCELSRIKEDTVRKMEQILQNRITGKLAYHGWYLKETVFPKIAKEILEGL